MSDGPRGPTQITLLQCILNICDADRPKLFPARMHQYASHPDDVRRKWSICIAHYEGATRIARTWYLIVVVLRHTLHRMRHK